MESLKLKNWLPHILAIIFFLLAVVIFFKPAFFDHKTLSQHDINQFKGSSHSLLNYRTETGKEGLWADAMFSGMPAYLINVHWANGPMIFLKHALSVFLQHPIENIFIAMLCYYIMLLSFQVRPYLATAGAIAFAFSSYMIIGLAAGHNSRIGAIAFIPLVIAGIHLVFREKKILGIGVTCLGLALHLNENHLQATYYLALIVAGYGIVQMIYAAREKQIGSYFKSLGLLILPAVLAVGSFFGQFWAVTEYSHYSTRGPVELTKSGKAATIENGLDRDYAFMYSDGIGEPLSVMIPNIYGGTISNYLVKDQESKTYKALVANSRSNEEANQLAGYATAYFGEQGAPYYAGAIICFLFVLGILFADKKYVWWLVPLSIFSVMLSLGGSFSSFNNLMFDYFPMYNKFRSVTFALIIILFAMPLLGMLGLEKLLELNSDKSVQKKLYIALGATGGVCLLIILFAGMIDVSRTGENQLPEWFTRAMQADRISVVRADALRSLLFILPVFVMLIFSAWKKVSAISFYLLLIFLITIDVTVVAKRYVTKENYQSKSSDTFFTTTAADNVILQDKSDFRVLNLQDPMNEARTSYNFKSLGGYHGAKMRRYQDLYDSCISFDMKNLINDAQTNALDFKKYHTLNMLNAKYIVYGDQANAVLTNNDSYGSAWFVNELKTVKSANEEIASVKNSDTHTTAFVDATKFKVEDKTFTVDSTATIKLLERKPPYLKFESNVATDALAVFCEIYYPKGWHAFIDGNETEILRADYILRALQIPAGKHVIEFKFEPQAFILGNKITMASNWGVLLIILGSIAWSFKKKE
jgi:MFS family permease